MGRCGATAAGALGGRRDCGLRDGLSASFEPDGLSFAPVVNCYFLCVCQGSVVDRFSNNASLFSLVEQINLPELSRQPSRSLPLEVHAYFLLEREWIEREVEFRFALVAATGLETFSDVLRFTSKSERFRLRTLGLPLPPLYGPYSLKIDIRTPGTDRWTRQVITWPMLWAPTEERPRLTH
jgi:hypothetical protein